MMQAPVGVLAGNTKRDTGKKAQTGNIMAAKASWVGSCGQQRDRADNEYVDTL